MLFIVLEATSCTFTTFKSALLGFRGKASPSELGLRGCEPRDQAAGQGEGMGVDV